MAQKPPMFTANQAKTNAETPIEIIIRMPNEAHVPLLMDEINTGAPDPQVFHQFSAQVQDGAIMIKIRNTHNTEFCNGFLIAISDTIKGYQLAEKTEDKVSFYLDGEESAGAATCLASCGLWGESFVFQSKEQEILFKQYHETVKNGLSQGEKTLVQKLKDLKR